MDKWLWKDNISHQLAAAAARTMWTSTRSFIYFLLGYFVPLLLVCSVMILVMRFPDLILSTHFMWPRVAHNCAELFYPLNSITTGSGARAGPNQMTGRVLIRIGTSEQVGMAEIDLLHEIQLRRPVLPISLTQCDKRIVSRDIIFNIQ